MSTVQQEGRLVTYLKFFFSLSFLSHQCLKALFFFLLGTAMLQEAVFMHSNFLFSLPKRL